MTDQLDTAAIRAKAKMWHLPPGIADSILALCDALDAAVIVDECLRSEVDFAIADMTALRAALRNMTDFALSKMDDPSRADEMRLFIEARAAMEKTTND